MAFADDPHFDALVNAAVLNHPAAEKLLQDHPELIHARNRLKETALHFLVIEGYHVGVAFLAARGADVNTDDGYMTPLMSAALLGSAQAVRQLLALGADPGLKTQAGLDTWDFLTAKTGSEIQSVLAEHGFSQPVETD